MSQECTHLLVECEQSPSESAGMHQDGEHYREEGKDIYTSAIVATAKSCKGLATVKHRNTCSTSISNVLIFKCLHYRSILPT